MATSASATRAAAAALLDRTSVAAATAVARLCLSSAACRILRDAFLAAEASATFCSATAATSSFECISSRSFSWLRLIRSNLSFSNCESSPASRMASWTPIHAGRERSSWGVCVRSSISLARFSRHRVRAHLHPILCCDEGVPAAPRSLDDLRKDSSTRVKRLRPLRMVASSSHGSPSSRRSSSSSITSSSSGSYFSTTSSLAVSSSSTSGHGSANTTPSSSSSSSSAPS